MQTTKHTHLYSCFTIMRTILVTATCTYMYMYVHKRAFTIMLSPGATCHAVSSADWDTTSDLSTTTSAKDWPSLESCNISCHCALLSAHWVEAETLTSTRATAANSALPPVVHTSQRPRVFTRVTAQRCDVTISLYPGAIWCGNVAASNRWTKN